LLTAYKGELKEVIKNDPLKRIKMCSIASSSRFCYLASKTLFKITKVEVTDLVNECCKPHYDGWSAYDPGDKRKNVYYEFKCHEFCSTSHDELSNSYKSLLKKHFNIEVEDTRELKFSDFGLAIPNDPYINKINFDFKQFLCHILGLLTIATKNDKPTLHYVWVVPYCPDSKELDDFIDLVDGQIDSIFDQMSDVDISTDSEKGKLGEFIHFSCEIIPANSIDDFVLENIE